MNITVTIDCLRAFVPFAGTARVIAIAVVVSGMGVTGALAQVVSGQMPNSRNNTNAMDPFGSPDDDKTGPSLWVSGFEGYQSSGVGTSTSSSNLALQQGSSYTGANIGAGYAMTGRRGDFSTSGQTILNYYQGNGIGFLDSYGGSAAGSLTFGPKTTLSGSGMASYAPFFNFASFAPLTAGVGTPLSDVTPVGPSVPSTATASAARPTYRYTGSISLRRSIGRRSSFAAHSNFYHTLVQGTLTTTTQSTGAVYTQSLSRYLSAKAGYQYQTVNLSGTGATPTVGHNLDVGVDYNRPLSFSRRTTLQFGTGSTVFARNQSWVQQQANTPSSAFGYVFYLQGFANLDHDMGRTWKARLAYHRDWHAVQGFGAPFFSDAVTTSLGGHISRRTNLSLTAAYVQGTFGLGTQQKNTSHTETAWLTYMLSRSWQTFAHYAYYGYVYDPTVTLPVGLPPNLGRHTAQVGLTWRLG